MNIYVAVIDGEALFAFAATDYVDALAVIHERDGAIQSILDKAERPDGTVLWNGRSEISVRLATDDEHMHWVLGQEDEIEFGGEIADYVVVRLVPTRIDCPDIL